MSFVSQLKAVIFLLILLVTGVVGTLTVNGILFPLMLVWPRAYRSLFDLFNGFWEWQAAFLMEKFIGLKVVICGDVIQPEDQSVVMMNHRTCFDWMYFWSVLIRQCGAWGKKIIVKSPLRHIPGPGWGMQCGAFLFLNRKWEDDENYLKTMINYFADIDYKTQILIFPEGTDFNEKSKKRSDEFALKHNLTPLTYLLHPRTTGLTFVVTKLQQRWRNVSIYDVTVAYTSSFPQNEGELASGILPSEVHFHVKRFSSAEVPQSADELAQWCKDRWTEKEHRLQYFYANGRFQEQGANLDGHSDAHLNRIWFEVSVFLVSFAWLIGTVLMLFCFFWYTVVKLIYIPQVVMFVYLWYRGSGFDVVQTSFFNRFFRKVSNEVKLE